MIFSDLEEARKNRERIAELQRNEASGEKPKPTRGAIMALNTLDGLCLFAEGMRPNEVEGDIEKGQAWLPRYRTIDLPHLTRQIWTTASLTYTFSN